MSEVMLQMYTNGLLVGFPLITSGSVASVIYIKSNCNLKNEQEAPPQAVPHF